LGCSEEKVTQKNHQYETRKIIRKLFLELVVVALTCCLFFLPKHVIVNGNTFKKKHNKNSAGILLNDPASAQLYMFCNTKSECCTDRIRNKAVNKAVERWCTAAVVRFHPLIAWPHSQFQKLLPSSQSTIFVRWKTISKTTAEFTEHIISIRSLTGLYPFRFLGGNNWGLWSLVVHVVSRATYAF
jgi:hypothetical protein